MLANFPGCQECYDGAAVSSATFPRYQDLFEMWWIWIKTYRCTGLVDTPKRSLCPCLPIQDCELSAARYFTPSQPAGRPAGGPKTKHQLAGRPATNQAPAGRPADRPKTKPQLAGRPATNKAGRPATNQAPAGRLAGRHKPRTS